MNYFINDPYSNYLKKVYDPEEIEVDQKSKIKNKKIATDVCKALGIWDTPNLVHYDNTKLSYSTATFVVVTGGAIFN
jgi:hypothetical protein